MLSTLFSVLLMSTAGSAQYTLQQDYFAGGGFLSQFSFWSGPDPTQGFVEYVDQATAQAGGLVSTSTGSVRLGVNSQDVTTTGRQSVRLTSKQSYQSGLVVLDLAHMPGGICGTWPAFWMVGPNWPSQGEIDIIEGVNDVQTNQMTLHTGNTCSIGTSSMLGSVFSNNCDVSSGDNTGCAVTTSDRATYGAGFNAAGGGTYATQWTSSSISVYFFPRGREPADLSSGSPNPATWGEPMAHFAGGCDIAQSFTNQQIVFDTTFCGQWAGEVWDGSSCAQRTGTTCENYVGQNPAAFREAYWEINGLKVYSGSGAVGSGTPSGAPRASGRPGPSGFATSVVPGPPSGAPFQPPAGSGFPQPPAGSGAPQPPASGFPQPPAGSGFPQGPPAGSAAPAAPSRRPQGSSPAFAPQPSQAPAPSGQAPAPFSQAPAPSAAPAPSGDPGHFGGGGRHHFGGPPGRGAIVDIQTTYVTEYVTARDLPQQTGSPSANDSQEDLLSRQRRHLGHHLHRHGHSGRH